MEKKVGIVIVNYNGEEYQNDCIRSLKKMKYSNFEIIVIDSNSSDNSISFLREEFGDVIIIEEKYNCGVARGNNIGIQYCMEHNADYILLLNNDIEVDEYMLDRLMENASYDVITVPKIYYFGKPDVLWFAGGEILWNKMLTIHTGIREKDIGSYDRIKEITFAPACCMLIHRCVFQKIGYLDEKVFMYFEDTDLCVRLIEGGYILKYVPAAKMWHKVSSATGGEDSILQVYYMNRNRLYFMDKYKNKIGVSARIYTNLKAFIKYIIHPFYKKTSRYILTAYCDYYRGKMGEKTFHRRS